MDGRPVLYAQAFVYHCQTEPFSIEGERFKTMEWRLMHAIINPAMMFAFFFGLLLVLTSGVINWHVG